MGKKIVTPEGFVEVLVYEEKSHQIWRKRADPKTGHRFVYEVIPVDEKGRRMGEICPEPFSLREAKKILERKKAEEAIRAAEKVLAETLLFERHTPAYPD